MKTTRVMIADNQPIVVCALKGILENEAGVVVVAQAYKGDQVVPLVRAEALDIVLMDIDISDASGLALVEQIKSAGTGEKIIIFSLQRSPYYVIEAIKRGADGYVFKDDPVSSVVEALHVVRSGKRYLPLGVAEILADRLTGDELKLPHDTLTRQELLVLERITCGEQNQKIARQLCISPKTVSSHRRRIRRKLSAVSDVALMRYCIDNGLFERNSMPVHKATA